MTRTRPMACPIAGCRKRGKEGDLMRHARSKHPDLTPRDYSDRLHGRSPRPGTRAHRRAAWRKLWSMLAFATACLILAAYITLKGAP